MDINQLLVGISFRLRQMRHNCLLCPTRAVWQPKKTGLAGPVNVR